MIRGPSPFEGPFALGHEAIAEVVDVGPGARFYRGQFVVVSWHISCGSCHRCVDRGKPNPCDRFPKGAAFGSPVSHEFGGTFADLVRVPHANASLVPLLPNRLRTRRGGRPGGLRRHRSRAPRSRRQARRQCDRASPAEAARQLPDHGRCQHGRVALRHSLHGARGTVLVGRLPLRSRRATDDGDVDPGHSLLHGTRSRAPNHRDSNGLPRRQALRCLTGRERNRALRRGACSACARSAEGRTGPRCQSRMTRMRCRGPSLQRRVGHKQGNRPC